MPDSTTKTFGYLIAFAAPGLLALYGLSFRSTTLGKFLETTAAAQTSVGAFLILGVAALGIGVILSAVRTATIDRLLMRGFESVSHAERPAREGSYQALLESHWRYYQSAGNAFVAIVFAFVLWLSRTPTPTLSDLVLAALLVLCVEASLLYYARAEFAAFYRKTKDVLSIVQKAA